MSKFKLSSGEYVVGKKLDGSLVNVLSYNFVNNTYQVIGLGGEGLTHTVEGRNVELLTELMTYTDDYGNLISIFKGSVVKLGDRLRVVVDVDVEDERVYYKMYQIHELLSESFLKDKLEGVTSLSLENFSKLIEESEYEYRYNVKIYSSLEDFIKFSKEYQDMLELEINRDLIEQEIDELFNDIYYVDGFIKDEGITVSICKNDLAEDEYDIIFSHDGIGNYKYKRVTVDKETLIDMIEDSTLLLMKNDIETELELDDVCDCGCLEEDELEDFLFLDEEFEEWESELESKTSLNLAKQLELEELITEITDEPFDLDVLFASTPDEVHMEHMSDLEFKEYQLEMMETFLKASKLIEFEDEEIKQLVVYLETNITLLRSLINLVKYLNM